MFKIMLFLGLLISGVEVAGKGKSLKLLRTDSELLLHKSRIPILASHALYSLK